MSFLSHSSYPCHCPFCHHPSDVLLLILSPIWPFLNLLTNLAFLKTISLSFKLSSVIPTSGILLWKAAQMPQFPPWILHYMSSEIQALSSEITQPRFILCIWRCIPGLYYVFCAPYRPVQHLLDFSTWITYRHHKLTCPKKNDWFSPSKPVNPPSLSHFVSSNAILFVCQTKNHGFIIDSSPAFPSNPSKVPESLTSHHSCYCLRVK